MKMKYLKLYENLTVQSIGKIIDEFYGFLKDIKPAVFEKYVELANDPDYDPDFGSKPSDIYKENDLFISAAGVIDRGFQFYIQTYNNNGEVDEEFYIEFTNEEMEEALLKLSAKKYNL